MANKLLIVTAVHNEEAIIKRTLTAIHQAFQENGIAASFIVCEDGSTDNTVPEIVRAQKKLPLKLISSAKRKGYSRAVLDGLRAAKAPYVAYIDSDGQYFPEDLVRLYRARQSADLVIGYRHSRKDPVHRLMMSRLFGFAYRTLTHTKLKDPSSPCLVISQAALNLVLRQPLGLMEQGLWWEFYAYATRQPITWRELPINHRPRAVGQTSIYRPSKVPALALRHLSALIKVRQNLKQLTRFSNQEKER